MFTVHYDCLGSGSFVAGVEYLEPEGDSLIPRVEPWIVSSPQKNIEPMQFSQLEACLLAQLLDLQHIAESNQLIGEVVGGWYVVEVKA